MAPTNRTSPALLAKFTCFQQLPREVRLMIWSLVAPPPTTQIIKIYENRYKVKKVPKFGTVVPFRPVTGFTVNRETFMESQKGYTLIRPGGPLRSFLEYHPERDIFYPAVGTVGNEGKYWIDFLDYMNSSHRRIRKLAVERKSIVAGNKAQISAFLELDELFVIVGKSRKQCTQIFPLYEGSQARNIMHLMGGTLATRGQKASKLIGLWKQLKSLADKTDDAKMPDVKVMILCLKDPKYHIYTG
ncbi:hypothetical protein B7494_g2265 [Chlorociboria aeruginascens]|nr:hypothetical protein B7494_g2265 [Chlorociboria aeruginascens]